LIPDLTKSPGVTITPHGQRHSPRARLDRRHIRTPADELLLRLVSVVRPGAAGRVGHARVPDSRLHAAGRVWRLRERAQTKTSIRIPVP
jgi:hypothetical protein